MKTAVLIISSVVILFILPMIGCHDKDIKSQFSINDFPVNLRPRLLSVVEKGFIDGGSATPNDFDRSVGGDFTATVFDSISDNHLRQLIDSEHPLIRVTAILEKLHRDSLADNEFIIEHLHDTAVIAKYWTEYGYPQYTTVADEMLGSAEWKSDSLRMTIVREVILRHNTLKAAFDVVASIPTDPRLYTSIRMMSSRHRFMDEREKALLALAKFKRPEDIPFIKSILLDNYSSLDESSFNLMQSYKDKSYLEVLEKFFTFTFNWKVCGFSDQLNEKPALECLASYRDTTSARLLTRLWNRKPPADCNHLWMEMKGYLLDAIHDNPCDSYRDLRKITESAYKERTAGWIELTVPQEAYGKTSPEIRWR